MQDSCFWEVEAFPRDTLKVYVEEFVCILTSCSLRIRNSKFCQFLLNSYQFLLNSYQLYVGLPKALARYSSSARCFVFASTCTKKAKSKKEGSCSLEQNLILQWVGYRKKGKRNRANHNSKVGLHSHLKGFCISSCIWRHCVTSVLGLGYLGIVKDTNGIFRNDQDLDPDFVMLKFLHW